jgi:hypothetical protein
VSSKVTVGFGWCQSGKVIQSGFQKVSQLETKVFKVTSEVQSLARAVALVFESPPALPVPCSKFHGYWAYA